MADVLAIPGVPKPWMAHPKDYTDASRDLITAYASGFLGISDNFDRQLFASHTDWYSLFCPSTSDSQLDFHLPHHPSPKTQTQHPRKLATTMMNQNRLLGQPMHLMDDRGHYMHLQVEDARAAAYSQSMSPLTVRLDLNSTLSSSGSTYCESDIESLEHFEEPFTSRSVEKHAGLVHPTPLSNMFATASNSFLSGTEETSSLSSFEVPNVSRDGQASSSTQFNVPNPIPNPNIANYPMNTHLGPHPHNTYLTPPFAAAHAKSGVFGQVIQWGASQPANTTDIWYPTRDPTDVPESSWHNNGYSAPWPVSNAYTLASDCNERLTGPMSHFSPLPTPGTFVASIEPPQYQPTMQPMYVPNAHDTDFASLDQKPASSLSPSFSSSSNEEGRSPQHSGEEQGSIGSSVHYSDNRDAFLIDCKRRGLSYKDIKRVGGFKEAESTLRGRYRTLTKSKDQRVRKPRWLEKDIRLLRQAVNIHAETPDNYSSLANASMSMSEPPKVSWKKVAEHIWAHGGSYHFGNATCKKKWCEIHHITL
ncbi:hypothetical protein N7519_008640 [Penicillium mononematosum]|uniref:uncharacterized protein n=1 Tax=Penicillium mononematosum TaxID=268346 RepID=UPI002546B178|nr:uncharacterized protein N7519_008640 [Penicillium mononematosum]KAJ6178179.1 hypothetical protein N7519_008640 [Penicillium mononematosum]